MPEKESRLVYSTGVGDQRKQTAPEQTAKKHQPDKPVKVSKDSKARKGKTVTLVTNLPGSVEAIADLAKTLKAHCGTGGSVTDEGVVIQGDHREKVAAFLKSKGFRVQVV